MKTYTEIITLALSLLSACVASPIAEPVAELEDRAGKPTGGPASATVTIYSSYTCGDPNVAPAGNPPPAVVTSFAIAETQCVIAPLAFGNALTANMIAAPKTGTVGCYIQAFQEQGCGLTLGNQYHGFPFNGVTVGSHVGCGQNALPSGYGAFQIVCG